MKLLISLVAATLAVSTSVASAACSVYAERGYGGQHINMPNGAVLKFLPEGSPILRQIPAQFIPFLEGKISSAKVSGQCRLKLYGVGAGAPGHVWYDKDVDMLPANINDKVGAADCVC